MMGSPFKVACHAGLLALLVGCGSSREAVTLLVSGDTRGWITPCGCTSNQSGGLARRDSLIQSASSQGPTLVLDVGGAVDGSSEYDWEKLVAILRGQRLIGLDAFNLGATECGFAAGEIRRLQKELEIPFVSANVRDAAGNPLAPAMIQLDRGGQSFAVIGVIDPALVQKPMEAVDPYRAVFDLLPSITTDRTVILAYMDQPELRALAAKLPDVDAVIGGPTGQAVAPVQVGSVMVASCTNKGKFLLELNAPAVGRMSGEVVEVTSGLPMAERQQTNLERFYETLRRRDFAASQTSFVSERILQSGDDAIAGSKSCLGCHRQDDSVWHDSKHSHAWASLQATGAEVDPACQRCHTTGYGMAGGFDRLSFSTGLQDVGCENCHGPSSRHVADPRRKTPFLASQQCVQCHDHENSPKFQYEGYWAKVRHGPQANAKGG